MTVYLLHFDQPIGSLASRTGYAQHYTGSASNLAARLAEHLVNSDVKIMQAVRAAGIGWTLARTWPGGRARERQIKKQGGAARHCPVCRAQAAPGPAISRGRGARPIPAWRRLADEPEPAPLWESVVAYLDPVQGLVLLQELAAAERDAWQAAIPGSAQYEARFATACDLSRLRGEEASATVRLAEARRLAEAEGWFPEPVAEASDPVAVPALVPVAAEITAIALTPNPAAPFPRPDPILARRGPDISCPGSPGLGRARRGGRGALVAAGAPELEREAG